jgi:hypothetical protein
MTIDEIKGVKPTKSISPLTPAKARIDSLKRSKDVATKNLKAERDRQKLAKAQQTITTVTTSLPRI